MAEDGKLMGFGIFEGFWLTVTGTVVRSTDIDLGSEGNISIRLKMKDGLLYAVTTIKSGSTTLYYPMDFDDLRNLEAALLAAKKQLEPSRLSALIRENDLEMTRLGTLARTWRRFIDTPVWKEDMLFGGGAKISFRVRRRLDRRFEIAFKMSDETHSLRVKPRELEALEDALIEARTAIESSKKPTHSAAV